jgi:hypothetical protein
MERDVVGITISLARDDTKFIFYLLFNSSLAYFVNLTNFLVTKHTSALTLQVSSPVICTGITQASLSEAAYREQTFITKFIYLYPANYFVRLHCLYT